MSEFITIGEPLVVFCSTQLDKSITDSTNFNKVIGGAELNVAIGVSRLEHSTQYISQIGNDPQGQFIKNQITSKNIDTQYLNRSDKYFTGYQMKQLVSKGDPNVYNFRKGSAASHINLDLIDDINLSGVKVAHLTGIFPAISKDAKESSFYLAKKFNRKKIILTFDPNLRPTLWSNKAEMIKTINNLAQYADIVLPGQNEGKILTGTDNPEEICDFYLKNQQTKAAFVKVGVKGSYVKLKGEEKGKLVPGFIVKKVVDTVGAGDGFALGVITALLEGKNHLQAACRGNAIGAMQVQTHGDNDGYPTRKELAEFYRKMALKNYAFV